MLREGPLRGRTDEQGMIEGQQQRSRSPFGSKLGERYWSFNVSIKKIGVHRVTAVWANGPFDPAGALLVSLYISMETILFD